MLRKPITYVDPFTEHAVTEEFYFHLSKADIIHMELGQKGGGLKAHIERIVAAEDAPEVMKVFKEIIGQAYGKRIDGKFVKNKEQTDEFFASEAYGELLMEMLQDPAKAAEFVNGIAPKDSEKIAVKASERPPTVNAVADIQATQAEQAPEKDPTGLTDHVTPRVLTQNEVIKMDSDELKAGLAEGRYKLS